MKKDRQDYFELYLDLDEPIEIGDLSAFFNGISSEFEVYLKEERPELRSDAKIYVREIREGSIIAEIFANVLDLVGLMDGVMVVGGFGALFSKRIRTWMKGEFVKGATKSDLNGASNVLRALAKDRDGNFQLRRFKFVEGLFKKEIVAEFGSDDARAALEAIEVQKQHMDESEFTDFKRVLMTYKRMDKEQVKPGSGTGDRVLIEKIDTANKPVFYGSDLASARIKEELTSSEYPFKLGFVVDVNVVTKGGRVSAYSVLHVHEVIVLDD